MARTDPDDDVDSVTAGGSRPGEGGAPIGTQGRSRSAAGSEPNGWFAGPHSDPDRFELLGPGLAGGEGNTWRARYKGELAAPLTLAVKELRRPVHAPADWPTPADVRRWDDQRALLQYMRIDHLVTVVDIFIGPPPHLPGPDNPRSTPDTPYVAMEWVPGRTLADLFSGEAATASTLDQRLAHVQHVAEALHALHSQTASAGNPTLHRDVKPTNCIVDPRRGVVLVDVGTMRRMDDGYDQDGLHTPAYTAPEVLADPQIARAPSSDLYSLGALAYFCVLGEDPPTAPQPGSTPPGSTQPGSTQPGSTQIEARLLAAARAAGVADPRAFVDHLRLMLEPAPEQRPGDAMAWSRRLRSLAAIRGRRPFERRWAGIAALAVVAAVVAAVVIFTGWPGDHGRPSLASASASPGPDPAQRFGPGPPPEGPPPDGPPPPRASGPIPSGPPVRTRLAAFTAPANGAAVPQCVVVTGTSKLPAGRTLVVSVENLNAGDGVRHLTAVPGWAEPSTLSHWRAPLSVGRPGDPLGGHYRLEVFAVPLAAVQRQIQADGGDEGRLGINLPAGSHLAASVFVTRSAQANAC